MTESDLKSCDDTPISVF